MTTLLPKIISSLLVYERGFFPSHLSRQLKHLYVSNAIFTFAVSAGAVFESIYLYTVGFSVVQIMLFFAGVYAIHFCAVPLGGKVVKRFGFEHGMMYGSGCLILYYVSLVAIQIHWAALLCAVFFLAAQKTLFWPGYHADCALFGQDGERGRELSNITILDSVMAVLGPLCGGVVATMFGFPAYFALVCGIMILSNLPFLTAKETFVPSDFSYRKAYANLLKPKHRKYLLGYLGYGEEIILISVWPVFLYLLFASFSATGALIAASTLVTAIVLLYVGRATDRSDRASLLRVGSVLTIFSWILRLATRSGASIFLVDFSGRMSKGVLNLPLFSGLYEYAHKNSVVESAIFFEMSVALGKMLVALILAGIFAVFPDGWGFAFGIGALFSLLYLSLTLKARPVYAPITE